MRTRSGFISNSSSCSFVISKDKLTKNQFLKAKHHLVEETYNNELFLEVTGWDCRERDTEYYFTTSIDNFCMISFLQAMGVKGEDMKIYHSNSYDDYWAEKVEQELGIKISKD